MGDALSNIAGVGQGVLTAIGAKTTADAEKDAAKFNAAETLRQAADEEQRIRRVAERQASVNIVRIAKSGVRLEGSPLSVLAHNAELVEKEALNVRHQGAVQAALFRARAKQAEKAGKLGVASGVLQGVTSFAKFF